MEYLKVDKESVICRLIGYYYRNETLPSVAWLLFWRGLASIIAAPLQFLFGVYIVSGIISLHLQTFFSDDVDVTVVTCCFLFLGIVMILYVFRKMSQRAFTKYYKERERFDSKTNMFYIDHSVTEPKKIYRVLDRYMCLTLFKRVHYTENKSKQK